MRVYAESNFVIEFALEQDRPPSTTHMQKQTRKQLEATLDAIGHDLASRAEELADRSTAGKLSPHERQEYAELVRLNDLLSLLKLEVQAFRTLHTPS